MQHALSARQDAWHTLGPALPDATTAQEAMKLGRLTGWNLRKEPIFAHVAGQQLRVPDRFAVVRDSPLVEHQVDVLGDVGKIYKIIQNEQMERLLDTLQEESGATYETAGELDGGRRAFVTLKMPGTAKVGGVDKVDSYLAAMNSHDGNGSTVLMVTPVRVTGGTTLNLAFKGADHLYKVRHTTGADAVLAQQAHEALEFTYSYLDGFQEQAKQLASTKLTQAKFEQLISTSFGAPKGAAGPTVTRTQNKLDTMAELFSDSFAQATGGTAWAGLTALTEWYDHCAPVRPLGDATEAETRSRRSLLDPSFKDTALKLMLKLV